MRDAVFFQDNTWALAKSEGKGLFHPRLVGITNLHTTITILHRMYRVTYEVTEDVRVRELKVTTEEPTPIGGVFPEESGHFWRYKDLDIPCHFSGRMLIVRSVLGFKSYRDLLIQGGTVRDVAKLNAYGSPERVWDQIRPIDWRSELE